MKRRNRIWFALCAVSLYTASVWADLVHVVEQREVDGVTTVMRDETKITGMPWAKAPTPSVAGALFTHWTISTQQDFAARDAWGVPPMSGDSNATRCVPPVLISTAEKNLKINRFLCCRLVRLPWRASPTQVI